MKRYGKIDRRRSPTSYFAQELLPILRVIVPARSASASCRNGFRLTQQTDLEPPTFQAMNVVYTKRHTVPAAE